MTYTVETLASGAYFLAGVLGRNFQTATGVQTNLGIDWLNDIIADKTIDSGMIPYYSNLTFTAIPGQPQYFFPNLIEVQTCVFYINSVRYAMTQIGRRSFRGDPRAENIQSLPFNYNVERQLGGAMLSIYFSATQAFPMEMWGLFRMQQVVLNQDLELTLDRFYINYLKYKLAERICQEYNYAVPEGVIRQLREYDEYIDKASAKMDITMNKISALSPFSRGVNYGVVNLGPWAPN
jgi:hypothetical protein